MQRYVAGLGELQEGKKIHCTSVSDPDWIQVQLSQRIRIRIPNPDPDQGGQKLSTEIDKKLRNFMF